MFFVGRARRFGRQVAPNTFAAEARGSLAGAGLEARLPKTHSDPKPFGETSSDLRGSTRMRHDSGKGHPKKEEVTAVDMGV